MLQNPSKYHHPNPLSHFLALHNSQVATHNVHSHTHTLPAAAISGHNNQLHQQPHHHHPLVGSHPQHPLRSPHPHPHPHPHSHPHAHLIDATNTTLDVGKSFTIAAILGLQKSALESSRKEYSNVINLSLNGSGSGIGSGCSSGGSSSNRSLHNLTPSAAANEMDKGECRLMPNNNNAGNKSSSSKMSACNSFAAGVNNFNCDNNAAAMSGAAALVNRYLPSANAASVSVSSAATFVVSAAHQQQQQHLAASHVRANSFAAAAAVAAAAAASAAGSGGGGTPSALQSLQQLHQHHAQQTSLSFQREKIKADGNNAKKSSLKNKRVRTIFTPEQLERLEAEFERQQYMVGPERLYLAHTLQLTEAQVKVWFQNRRIKWRKHHLEITQQRLALLRQNQLPVGASNTGASAAAVISGALTPSVSCEEIQDIKNCEDIRQLDSSRQASDSDLSICNDSMDADSTIDGGEDT